MFADTAWHCLMRAWGLERESQKVLKVLTKQKQNALKRLLTRFLYGHVMTRIQSLVLLKSAAAN